MSSIWSVSGQESYVPYIMTVEEMVVIIGGKLDTDDVDVATVVEIEVSRSCLFWIVEVNEVEVVITVAEVAVTCDDGDPFCWAVIREATVLKVCATTDIETTLLAWTTTGEVDDIVENVA